MFEPSDDEDETIAIDTNGYRAMQQRIAKTGFRIGLSSGQGDFYQRAFDLGFQVGFRSAFERVKYRQFFNLLSVSPIAEQFQSQSQSMFTTNRMDPMQKLYQEMETYRNTLLPLPPVELKPSEFERKDPRSTLTTLSEMADDAFNKFDDACLKKLPKTYALLNFEAVFVTQHDAKDAEEEDDNNGTAEYLPPSSPLPP